MKLGSLFKSFKQKSQEKRYGLRILAEDLFLVEFKRGGKMMRDKGFGCDLSFSGAKFKTLIPFQKGETIHMVFRLSPKYPGSPQIELDGRVTRSHRTLKTYYHQISCHFLGGQEKQKQLLQDFLKWIQSPSESAPEPASLSQCRRVVNRIQAKDTFLLEFKRDGKKILHKGYGCDLSPLGASFMTLAPLRKHEKLEASLHFSPEFPGPKNLELEAEVMQVEISKNSPYARAGCRFQDQKGLAKWVIRQFLDWVKSKKQ